jgi:dephospho-CoA kinase
MNPTVFGLTGGIASGKSTVSKVFARRGIPIVDADEIAHLIVRPGMPALKALVKEFGDGILTNDGEMDRQKVGSMVFGNPKEMARLNYTIGPYLRAACQLRIEKKLSEGHDLVCFDAPLLIEKGLQSLYRPVVVVYCEVETQIRRMKTRNGLTEEEARARIASQATHDQRLWHADFLISTDNTMEETAILANQVLDRVISWCRRSRKPLMW